MLDICSFLMVLPLSGEQATPKLAGICSCCPLKLPELAELTASVPKHLGVSQGCSVSKAASRKVQSLDQSSYT